MSDDVSLALKTVEEVAPHIRDFATSIGLLDPARQIVGSWTDRLGIRREVRRLEALIKAAETVRQLGVPTRAIKDRLLIEVLEGAADEDDSELHDMWSNLLAGAATGAAVAPAVPSVLRQLESIEVRLLDQVLRRQREQPPLERIIELDDLEGFDELEWRHLDNLQRLALIEYEKGLPPNIELPARPTPRDRFSPMQPRVRLSVIPFGMSFVDACSAPQARS